MPGIKVAYHKIKSIITGWWRFLFAKRSAMAKERLEVCRGCELRKGYFCGVCGCELHALAELTEDEGGICKHPNGSKWTEWNFLAHRLLKGK